jgi:hypothetical protein
LNTIHQTSSAQDLLGKKRRRRIVAGWSHKIDGFLWMRELLGDSAREKSSAARVWGDNLDGYLDNSLAIFSFL